jgi:hypothetical protein
MKFKSFVKNELGQITGGIIQENKLGNIDENE